MRHALVRLIGWPGTVLHGDPCVFDRWLWLRRNLRPGRLRTLDVGCGSGAFTLYAATIGNQAVGLSHDERNNAVAAERASILGLVHACFLTVDVRDLDRFAAELGLFDQIVCLETIEHLRDDRKLIADLSSLLRPGGRLLLTTPYKHYRRLVGDRLSNGEDGGHIRWGYTHAEMRRLLGDHGLDVEVEGYVSGIVSQSLTNIQRILSRPHPRIGWLLVFPLRLLQLLDRPLTRLLRYPYLSIAVVAVKRGLQRVDT